MTGYLVLKGLFLPHPDVGPVTQAQWGALVARVVALEALVVALELATFVDTDAAVAALEGAVSRIVLVTGDGSIPNSAGNYVYLPDAVITALSLTPVDNGVTLREVTSGDGWLMRV